MKTVTPSQFVWASTLALVVAACDRPTQRGLTASSAQSAATSIGAPPAPSAPPSAALVATAESPASPARSSGPPRSAAAVVSFDSEAPGAPSPSFEAVVGDWYVAEAAGAHGFEVDGSKWRNGTPSANLADQAKRLYGDRYAEFLDGVKAFAFFPVAVWKGEPPAGDLSISVRFYPLGGKVDQAAGIAFGMAADGSYLGIRANALENNVLYFRVDKGHRTVMDDIRNVPTPTRTWHTLSVEIGGAHVLARVDGQKRFEKTLGHAPAGKIGLWSKADSQVLFDDFAVESLSGAQP